MKHKVLRELLGIAALLFLFAGIAHGATMELTAAEEQRAAEITYVEAKCDPCDYNIDYGDTDHPAEKGGADEGYVKLECDPCDYNIDYGDTYQQHEK